MIPKLSDASDPGPACHSCGSKDEKYPSRILLCDCPGCSYCNTANKSGSTCDAAWHMSCLPQPLFRKPRGEWFCPHCSKSNSVVAKKLAKSAAITGATDDDLFNPLSYLPTIPEGDTLPQEMFLENSEPVVLEPRNHATRGRVRRGPVRYNPSFLTLFLLNDCINATVGNGLTPPDPQTLEEALASEDREAWLDATVSEVCSLLEKGTFQVVDKPDRPIVKSRWVFKRKVDAFGNFVKHKTRLVAKGFLQKFGIDFTDVFSPVTKLSTLRVLLSHVAALDLELKHVDVRTAFLNGELTEEVYIEVPDGLREMYPDKCLKLDKAIYGLKQAPRVWWLNLSTTLGKHGFIPSFADQCLFIKKGKHGLVYCLVYVDDMLFAGHAEDVQDAVNIILQTYDATDEGDAKSFLGLAIIRDRARRILKLSQKAYIEDMASRFSFHTEHINRKVTIPMTCDHPEPGTPLDQSQAGNFASLIGSMLYLANCTRPDISYAVGTLARNLRSPHSAHLKLAKHLLRYCIATKDLGLVFGPGISSEPLEVVGYSDSNYGGAHLSVVNEVINRRSVSGYVFLSNGTPVAWQSKKQHVMSRSSDDAEYVGMANAASTGLWIRKLYGEMSGVFKCLTIFGDNTTTLKHIEDPGSINKSKHIDIAYQFVLDRALRNDLKFLYVPSAENTADLFTKALSAATFLYLRDKLGVKQI